MSKYAIGVDYGTLSVRALLVNIETGEEAATSVYEYPHGVMEEHLPTGERLPSGWALQEPQDYVEGLILTIRNVLTEKKVLPEEVIGIGVDFTSSTVIPVKSDRTPLCHLEKFARNPHAYVKLWKHHGAEEEALQIDRIAKERGEKWLPLYGGKVSSEWMIPKKYVKVIGDTVVFNKAIFVDRHNQNITALERTEKGKWVVRSMNPSTTGLHRPPYAQETPLGMFVLQEKKVKMIFLKDGSKETGGYAPYASRFTDGAYIHGVPVNEPRKTQIEYSWSLGTTPRSHMCVRNATSHAKFIFDWAPVNETIIFVLE